MDKQELIAELGMPYNKLVLYLQNKYGMAEDCYFSPYWTKSRKISRIKEGLFCHHIDEDKGFNLSESSFAKVQPYEFQKANHLVYCNYLEHLLLHIKIEVIRQRKLLVQPIDLLTVFNTDGFHRLVKSINTLFIKNEASQKWEQNCFAVIQSNFEEYIVLLNLIIYYIDKEYEGERNDVASETNSQYPNRKYTYCQYLERCKRWLSAFYDESGSFKKVYNRMIFDRINGEETPIIKDAYQVLKKDFCGFGHPEYSRIFLDSQIYGSSSADEYLYRAFPAYSGEIYNIQGKTPVFWTGKIPAFVEKKHYPYVVRVSACFSIKKGEEPFIRFRTPCSHISSMECDCVININKNGLPLRGEILSDSFRHEKESGKIYEKYFDRDGVAQFYCVELTLCSNDFKCFRERYNVYYIQYKDGCYFKTT